MISAYHQKQTTENTTIYQNYSSEGERGKEKVKPTTICVRNGDDIVEDRQMECISILGVNLHNVICYFFSVYSFPLSVHLYFAL